MNTLTIYLIIVIVALLVIIHLKNKQIEVLDNNYNMCLMALSEFDPELKRYLEEQNERS